MGDAPPAPALERTSWFSLHWTLMKPRIILLLQITALSALLVHDLLEPPAGTRPWLETLRVGLIVLVGGTLAAGGANALNMWYDRDIDLMMVRTSHRPLPQGLVAPRHALLFGLAASVAGVAILGLFATTAAGLVTGASALFYLLIYTLWLKRRTPQNIVIGGVAGATPPLIGWVAAGGSLASPLPWLMFALIFLWTPPHFWSLALFSSQDYDQAAVPMLPVARGESVTRRHIAGYAVALLGLNLLFFYPLGGLGWFYLTSALLLGGYFMSLAWKVLRQPGLAAPRKLFHFSILYLFALFGAMVADAALKGWLG